MKEKSLFLSMAAHELKTPLAVIREGISLIHDGIIGEINEQQKKYLTMAQTSVDRLSRLIQNLLNYQKLDSGQLDFDFKRIDLNEMIRKTAEEMKLVFEKEGLTLKQDLCGQLPAIQSDYDKIKQVLINLINNAKKFTEKGGATVKSEIDQDNVVISVSDTGCGIPQDKIKTLFQPFCQAENKEAKEKGTGLGLAISEKIIIQHGGRIGASSQVGEGSTFSFQLPLKR